MQMSESEDNARLQRYKMYVITLTILKNDVNFHGVVRGLCCPSKYLEFKEQNPCLQAAQVHILARGSLVSYVSRVFRLETSIFYLDQCVIGILIGHNRFRLLA